MAYVFSMIVFSSGLSLTPVAAEVGDEGGGVFRGRHFPEGGISMEIKIIRPVYVHLNALQLSISVHQRCLLRVLLRLKCTKFIFGRGSAPYARCGASHALYSSGTSGKEGRQDERLPRAP